MVCYFNYRVAAVKEFGFTHLEGGRKGQGCSYWHQIGRNGGFAAAIMVEEESRIFF